MGLFSFFTSSSAKKAALDITTPPKIDLHKLSIDHSKLGSPVSLNDFFHKALQKTDVCNLAAQGVELGTKTGVLDYVLINVPTFSGEFLLGGELLNLSSTTSPDAVQRLLGEPYWTDRSDNEIILFYEPYEGEYEVQFEFPDSAGLGSILLAKQGVLSDLAQRQAYGVNKPWPPTSGALTRTIRE